jgi:hypothetical protein
METRTCRAAYDDIFNSQAMQAVMLRAYQASE